MNFRKNLVLASTLLAAAFATQASTNAQTLTAQRSGYYSLNLGNSWMGGSVFAGAALQARRTPDPLLYTRSPNYAYAALSADASVKFLNRTIPLAYSGLTAQARTGTSPYDASFSLYVRGVTERNQRFTTAGVHNFLSFYRTFDLFPVDPSASVSVAGVPVTVRGNVGVGVEATAVVNMVGNGYAGIGGVGRVWGYGRVSAQAGWSWAGAGVDLRATFANTRLSPSIHADARNPFNGGPSLPRIVGQISMTIQPIALKLDVWVALVLRYTHNLVNWAAPTISLFNILF